MKKIILGIAGVVIMAFVVVLFVNASNAPQEVKKPATAKETTMDCGKCASASTSAACGTAPAAKEATATKTAGKTADAKPASAPCCAPAASTATAAVKK